MSVHEFTAYLDREPDDDELDALFEAGLDDATPEFGGGVGMLHVAREAARLDDAIVTVVDNAETAGFRVVAVEDEDIVSLKTIAARTGRTYQSVRSLATGQRGPGGFPIAISGDGWSLYSWTAVADWFARHYGNNLAVDDRIRTLAAADHLLRARALVPNLEHLLAVTR
ncbi:MAG: hypothetical protein FWD74_03145 [Actinomycetia bacterium]|nr:hypothetical protein [Actinomycetes bacterium]